ncbi:MAG TPA: helix-turn-helix domain-containing protein [Dehalococcoidia bacterium]|nr:helix-turn-helix domain-containing protein [Dehalococcoidia bacterium]
MNAAVTVFSRHGYERATVDLVAQTAGYSKGAFYVHFDSKEAIFLEVLSEAANFLDTSLDGSVESMIESFAGLVGSHPYWAPLATEFSAHAWRNQRVREGMDELWARCGSRLESAAVESGMEEGRSARNQAELLLNIFRGASMEPGVTAAGVRRAMVSGAQAFRSAEAAGRRGGRAA